jgi:hypothetical protein
MFNVGILAVGILIIAACQVYLGGHKVAQEAIEEVVETAVKVETGEDAEAILADIEKGELPKV